MPAAMPAARRDEAGVTAPQASQPQARPEGWYGERATQRPVVRAITHDEQSSTTLLSVPPLAPPFREGWQAERFIRRPIARALTSDEQSSMTLLSMPPLSPPFKEGWQSDRFRLQPIARTTPHDEQQSSTIYKVPPLAQPFAEGWQAERFVWRPTSRSLVRDEQSSMTLLSVPPLAIFREGWQSDRTFVKTGRSPLAAYHLDFKPAPPAPLSFPEGWQSERAVVPRKFRSPVDAVPSHLSVPPLAGAFREGWQSDRTWQAAIKPRRAVDEQTFSPGVATPWGWQSDVFARTRVSRPPVATHALDFAPARSIVPFGWEAYGLTVLRGRSARTAAYHLDFRPSPPSPVTVAQRKTFGDLGTRTGTRKSMRHQGGL